MARPATSSFQRLDTKITSDRIARIAKLPPQNVEAEQSLLGGLLIDKDAIVTIAESLRAEDFYKTEQHGQIYNAILELYEKREPIDVVTVTARLKQNGVLDRVGGSAYLTELVNMVPTAAHIQSYGRIIKELALRRNLISNSTKFIDSAYDESREIQEIIEESEQSIFSISQQHIKRDFIQLKDAIAQSFDRLEEIRKNGGKLRGIPTGFRDLDSKLAGMQDSNLIIFAARPGMGKCLAFDSKIVDPQTGELKTIEEYYKQKIIPILTLDNNLRLQQTVVSHFVDDGEKEVFKVTTATGREIEVTASHPFLTIDGWKHLYEIQVGDRIATPRQLPIFGTTELEDYKVKALAYFLSDGGLTSLCPRFTNTSPVITADFIESVKSFDNVQVKMHDSGGQRAPNYEVVKVPYVKDTYTKSFSNTLKQLLNTNKITQRSLAQNMNVSPSSISLWVSGQVIPQEQRVELLSSYFALTRQDFIPDNTFHSFQEKNSVTRWLGSMNLMGKSALEKSIPDVVFTLPKEKLALFINRLFACDGSVYISNNWACISYSSSSKALITDLAHLLLRFGILAKVRGKNIRYNNKIFHSYELEIRGSEDIITFAKTIGIFSKEENLNKAYNLSLKKAEQNNFTKDTLPVKIWEQIDKERNGVSWAKIYQLMGLPKTHNLHVGKRNPKRQTVLKIAQALNSKKLEYLARSDIFWDTIVSIRSMGLKQVYDLTIPKTHNFIANDFFVHNTSFALNLAQHVAVNANLPVGIFSLEMSQEELVDRLLVSQADIDSWKMKTGNLDPDDDYRLANAMGILAEAPLFIDDTPGASLSEIRTKSRRLQSEHGLKMIIVDYLQLITFSGFSDNRVQQVSEISKGLKNLARELKVPVLALSQLSRAVENRTIKKPQLADLRESGSIEQDADVVMFIYREEDGEEVQENFKKVKLDIQKHRNGPTGEVDLIFVGSRLKFHGMEKTRVHKSPAAKEEKSLPAAA